MSHLYRRINYSRIVQLLEVIEGYSRLVRKELDECEKSQIDNIICDNMSCKKREYNDHDGKYLKLCSGG